MFNSVLQILKRCVLIKYNTGINVVTRLSLKLSYSTVLLHL